MKDQIPRRIGYWEAISLSEEEFRCYFHSEQISEIVVLLQLSVSGSNYRYWWHIPSLIN